MSVVTPEAMRHRRYPKATNARKAFGVLLRGYVMGVYHPTDPVDSNTPGLETVRGVLCDVQIIETGWRGILRRVPVARLSAGVWDYEGWEPKAASVNTTGGALNTEEGPAQTPQHDTDADLVMVAFLGGDLNRPVILGQLDNPNTLKGTDSNIDLQDFKWYRFIRGIFFGLHKDGRAVIDLSSASTGEVQQDGSQDDVGLGSIEITTRNGGFMSVDDGGRVYIETESGATFEFESTGSAAFDVAPGGKLSVQQGGLVESVMKADNFQTLLGSALIEIIAVGAAAGVPTMPNTSALLAAVQAGQYSAQSVESD